MKKIIFLLLITTFCYAQTEIKLAPDGIKPVVVDIDTTASYLYQKAINWVNTEYKNPDKVIKAKIENEMLRIEGYCNDCWGIKALGMMSYYDMTYTIEFEFKDNKYRFSITNVEFSDNGSKFIYSYKDFFNKKGEIRGQYEKSAPLVESSLQSIFTSSKGYITGASTAKKEEW